MQQLLVSHLHSKLKIRVAITVWCEFWRLRVRLFIDSGCGEEGDRVWLTLEDSDEAIVKGQLVLIEAEG